MQNIDTLERVAGLEGEDLIEAHGTFYTSHCVSFCCRKEYNLDWMKGVCCFCFGLLSCYDFRNKGFQLWLFALQKKSSLMPFQDVTSVAVWSNQVSGAFFL